MRSAILNTEAAVDYQVSSVRKALEILCAFTPETPRWTLSGLGRHLGIPKSTASNLLRTLQAFDLVRQEAGNKSYSIGPRAHELGVLYAGKTDLIGCALPRMRKLNELTKETIKLGVLSQRAVLVVAAIESPMQLHTRGDVGLRWHLHSSSLGKAMLSALPSAEVNDIVESGLPRFTPGTLADPTALLRDLRRTRERGYALEREENEEGVCCVAASIVDPVKGLTAAISMSGPTVRLTTEALHRHAQHVMAAARQIQNALRDASPMPALVPSSGRRR